MKKLCAIFLVCLLFSCKIFCQFNVAHTRLSVLTCAPGDELYSLFGHTALRIYDSSTHVDIVYNWGGFTFDQPNFYLKFMRGKLLYYSSADYLDSFMQEYIEGNRNVYEQVLNIDSASKKRVIDAVLFNSSGDNKFYKYDFLLDNCTTRVKNILFENLKGTTIKNDIVPAGTTSREMIHFYLERGSQLWSELGIDILLGRRLDKPVSNDEAMFLPEFFMKGLNNAVYQSKPLVKNFTTIFQGKNSQKPAWKYLPLLITTCICVLLFFISTLKNNWSKKLVRFFDALLLYVTGLIGVLLLFMWFGTDHTVCKSNYNLLWALPTNFIAAFCIIRKPSWLSQYFLVATIVTALLIALWFWLPQVLNIALLPVAIYLLNRYANFIVMYKR